MKSKSLTPRFKKAGPGATSTGWLLRDLPGLTDKQVHEAFGAPTTIYSEPHDGYGKEEWTFQHASKATPYRFTLYKRFGTYRIGGTGHEGAIVKFVERTLRRRARKTKIAKSR